jgi:hypothetical protein
MTIFTTSITQMYTVPNLTGYVINVFWKITGNQNGTVSSIDGNNQITIQNGIDTPYKKLTQAQIIDLIHADLGDQSVANYKVCVQDKIDYILNPLKNIALSLG